MLAIIPKRKIWIGFSGFLMSLSILAIIFFGLNLGIDFTGGSLLEVKFLNERPTVQKVQEVVSDLELGSLIVQPIGDQGLILRFQDTSEEKHQAVLKRLDSITLEENYKAKEVEEGEKSECSRCGQHS